MSLSNLHPNKPGFILITVSIFIFIFLLGATSLVSYIISNNKTVARLNGLRQAGYIAEAGIAKAVWCLNHNLNADCGGTAGLNYPGETNVTLATGNFTTTVTVSGQDRIIISTGTTATGITRTIKVEATPSVETTNASFSFGAQIGDGGLEMGNNSVIVGAGGTFGNVYSNGSITCAPNAAISGTAQVAGSGNKIDGCDIGYNGSGVLVNDLADAHAHTLKNCRIAHNGFIPTGGLSQSCAYGRGAQGGSLNNNYPLPPPTTAPITNQMIADWETEAAAGGIITGDYLATAGESLGPIKIEGNLTLPSGAITLGGTLWVEGNILFESNLILTLNSNYGSTSGVIIADDPANQAVNGIIELQNTVTVNGSGDPDSYIMLLSARVGDESIKVGNNSTNAIYATTQGEIKIGNNANVKAVIAYKLDVGNNMQLIYESGLASANFANGPGGRWKIKRGTWQPL